jgi:hypothetical protein
MIMMTDYKVTVTKLTDENLLQRAASMTTGKESHISLHKAYRSMHSLCRTQLFYIELVDIPSFVVGHLVRHVHAQPFVRSKRTDRGGADFNEVCRNIAFRVDTCWIGADVDIDDSRTLARAIADCSEQAQIIEQLPDKFDRLAPQSMSLLLSAEEIINISRLRLCNCASLETRQVWREVVKKIGEVDPVLKEFCVPTCIFRGGICPELKCCGYIDSKVGQAELDKYKELFTKKSTL